MTSAEAEARRLLASGYCPTSTKYRLVSRLDRPDWLEFMASDHVRGFPGDKAENLAQAMRWATGLGSGAADFYRRVLSQDSLELEPEVFMLLRKLGPSSHGWGGIDEYRDVVPEPSAS